MKEREIIEGLKTICKCKGIRKSVFVKLINGGMTTVQGLQKATGAGAGSCKGKHCTPLMEDLIKSVK